MAARITAEHLLEVINRRGAWSSRAVSWSVYGQGTYQFDYYACYVQQLNLWFLTGIDDWYRSYGGITTERLVEILAEQEVASFWATTDWDQLGFSE